MRAPSISSLGLKNISPFGSVMAGCMDNITIGRVQPCFTQTEALPQPAQEGRLDNITIGHVQPCFTQTEALPQPAQEGRLDNITIDRVQPCFTQTEALPQAAQETPRNCNTYTPGTATTASSPTTSSTCNVTTILHNKIWQHGATTPTLLHIL